MFGVLAAPAGARASSPTAKLQAAATEMQQSPGYTFRASIRSAGSTVHIKGEYQAPDRLHQKVRIGSGTPTEVAMIGTQVYERGTDGAWHQTPSSGGTATDPRTNFGVLANARNVSRRGQVCSFRLRPLDAQKLMGQSSSGGLRGRATLGADGISRLEYTTRTGGRPVDVRIDYVVTSPPPTVTTPH